MLVSQQIFAAECGSIRRNEIQNALQPDTIFISWFTYEEFELLTDAIDREKIIKGKVRKWKDELINRINPEWKDLTDIALLDAL
jgi:predicted GIY-YIG superfamily endonuclease